MSDQALPPEAAGAAREGPEDGSRPRVARGLVLRLVWLALLAALLVWTLRSVPLGDIAALLEQLTLQQIAALLALNSVVILLMSMRWWIILRAEGGRIPFLKLAGYRLAAFGVSYFTAGPQVGGEPLQVVYLQKAQRTQGGHVPNQKGHRLRSARATASVILDKLVEFTANSLFLAGGALVIARVGILARSGISVAGSLLPLAVLIAIPVIYVGLLYGRQFPLGMALRRLFPRVAPARSSSSGDASAVSARPFAKGHPRTGIPRLIVLSERMAGTFTRRHPGAMTAALTVSLVGWLFMAAEYWLMASFLGLPMTLWQALAGLAMALLSFLLPIPAGLGALEASQIIALGAMGYPPAAAVSLTLLIRARDLFFGGLGLLRAGRGPAVQ